MWRTRLGSGGNLANFGGTLIEPGRKTIADLLRGAGYFTGLVGKWHQGMDFGTLDGKPAFSKIKEPDDSLGLCNVDWKKPVRNGPNSVGFDYFWGIPASLDMAPYIWIENDRFVGECATTKAFRRWGPAQADSEDYKVLRFMADPSYAWYLARGTIYMQPHG